eukprot:m.31079 g.31079  ORF g.31079 m.31079 type:complete len:93 (-) comp14682_c0_seq1:188-466(-)
MLLRVCGGLMQLRSAMRGLHPRSYDVTLVLTDGSSINVQMSKSLRTLRLAEDILNSAPWSRRTKFLDTSGKVARFRGNIEADETFQLPPGAK